jgi:hypothetical protein
LRKLEAKKRDIDHVLSAREFKPSELVKFFIKKVP